MIERGAEALREEFLLEVQSRLIGPREVGEELREKPNKRYLTGMVFPRGANTGKAVADEEELADDASASEDQEEFESPMDMLFQRLPASVGLTFALEEKETAIRVEVAGARYKRQPAETLAKEQSAGQGQYKGAAGRKHLVWKQIPLGGDRKDGIVTFEIDRDGQQRKPVFEGHGSIHLFVRKVRGVRIATVSLINERVTEEDAAVSVEDILFQVQMTCHPGLGVPAYPDPPSISEDPEAEELALQYRSLPTFSVGHGCGVAWPDSSRGVVEWVSVDFLPAVEVPPVTTDIPSLPADVQEVMLLKRLQDPAFDPLPGFRRFIQIYADWRYRLAAEKVPQRFIAPRDSVLQRIDAVIRRLKDGVALLGTEPEAMRIFRLSNRAMLLSIARSDANNSRAAGKRFLDVVIDALNPEKFRWRPFQLAFFILSLKGLWSPSHEDRSIVDLIWFQTGGGKTEAYLAVAAFEMLRRRIVDGDRGSGTAVIKRYTLRLLTIQQFERAGSLICSLETMRRAGEIRSKTSFSLGLWVGKDSAPNEYSGKKGAIDDLRKIRSTIGKVEGVRVPLQHCPVCATPIVPAQKDEGDSGVGIRETGRGEVELFCPNQDCSFHDSLPISFIDEYLYAHPPTLLLGTIDKFAMLAWRDEGRAFFGTGQKVLPPSLIIQDELHLISGPLGTLAGIYEAAIDTAITRLAFPAKYICATATIRRADDQIRKLYGRKAALFPPPGLDASDSFFSREQKKSPGRLYVGAMGQGHTPTYSNVIASTALLAAGGEMREKVGDLADTWWTLVAYHNSKRELGKTLSLARDDIPARLKAMGERRTVAGSGVKELSANLRDSEIPETLHLLGIPLPEKRTLDFVACTNMLSVGVDVKRLGLMMVNGQPKTVAEYIQASSRVGRDEKRPPGIIFSLFSPSKPRDRSHYEFFRAFHRGFYRHVEPTSVTPFALPAQDRGMHGAFLTLVRMVSALHANNHASKIATQIADIRSLAEEFLERVTKSGDGDPQETKECLDRFVEFWLQRAQEKGVNLRFQSGGAQHSRLIRPFKEPGEGWETLQSLRHVDTPLRLLVPTITAGRT